MFVADSGSPKPGQNSRQKMHEHSKPGGNTGAREAATRQGEREGGKFEYNIVSIATNSVYSR